MTVFTIGHSTQPIETFLAALNAHDVQVLFDVRRFPGSRRHPQFGRERLSASLSALGIEYRHVPDLGGRRQPRPHSRNTAWKNASFRGYADHMETSEFRLAIAHLLSEAATRRVALMCAEQAWSHCHRGLIADYVKAMGHDVVHIVSETKHEAHPYTAAARVIDGKLSYQGLV
jgi:uncharacterized protein (DUF488 family)